MTKRGFTLVEIITAIGIVVLLTAFGLSTINSVRTRARDNQRIIDLKLIQDSLELYRTDIDRAATLVGPSIPVPYAYPLRSRGLTQPGIYNNVKFSKYLTETPKDPLTKKPYSYFAPGCLQKGLGSASRPAVASPAKDDAFNPPIFHTSSEIQSAAIGTYCPAGSGWVPYLLFARLEKRLSGNYSRASLNNFLSSSENGVAYSVSQPILVAGDATGTPTIIAYQSLCLPPRNPICPAP